MAPHDGFYIDGDWRPPSRGDVLEVVNPATEQVVGTAPAGSAQDVDRAVRAASASAAAWANTEPTRRAEHLARIRDGLAARQEDLAHCVVAEMGSPLTFSRKVQVGLPVTVAASCVELLTGFEFEEKIGNSRVLHEPAGVVAAITPWNYPLHQIVAKVVPALAAGCPVVLKPAENTPLVAQLFAEIVHEAGLPPGVFNLVTGVGSVAGAALAAHPGVDLVSFTGSTAVGRAIGRVAGERLKRVALELGGKSATVVLSDADLERAVRAGVGSAFANAGQTCSACTRMLVPADVHDEAVELAVLASARYRPGDPTDPATRLGPLVSARQRERVRGYLAEGPRCGARLAVGGAEPPDGHDLGYYVRPTIFADVPPDSPIAQEEIFGPVLSVIPYRDEDEALAIANGTPYGLSGAVWSADEDRAVAFARRMQTGQVDINGGAFNPLAPFGGYKDSGVGRELGRHGLVEFLQTKSLQF
ncbi:aldehyde dehydrogenase [Wenjunlia vitaminophila]|uniref:aldehyde dehydrogenase (NAD(+)) n=1 Tax=Wenjunlia vitaminophila TaxID=76728 RepID=A0A0T6LWS7_WENVI|nr:aldehyde dehydrogenase family protein [Wenjunlia vitaminophila]KRV50522.1 aldehyde dehydrogenase [Wenjunlia vitaminophila]